MVRYADVLAVSDVAAITGYTPNTVVRWMTKRLPAFGNSSMCFITFRE
ncbi:hypothetical protein [Ruminococcus flavefaciens]|nr:hypothetical protein [Ruminococcus flavefaciens]